MARSDKPAPRGNLAKLKKFTGAPLANDPDFPLYMAGVKEGQMVQRKEVLDYLQDKYMSPEIARDEPEAKYILKLASELSQYLKTL